MCLTKTNIYKKFPSVSFTLNQVEIEEVKVKINFPFSLPSYFLLSRDADILATVIMSWTGKDKAKFYLNYNRLKSLKNMVKRH